MSDGIELEPELELELELLSFFYAFLTILYSLALSYETSSLLLNLGVDLAFSDSTKVLNLGVTAATFTTLASSFGWLMPLIFSTFLQSLSKV